MGGKGLMKENYKMWRQLKKEGEERKEGGRKRKEERK